MDFVLVVGAFTALVLVFLALGKYYPGTGADVIDWKPTRSPELEVQLELDDIDQMLEAQNERRRRSGRREISEHDVRVQLDEDKRERDAHVERFQREREERGVIPPATGADS